MLRRRLEGAIDDRALVSQERGALEAVLLEEIENPDRTLHVMQPMPVSDF